MRILHTSDWHVGRTIRGRSRAGEHRQVLAEVVSIAQELTPDLTLIAGDLFDVTAPTAESEQIVYRTLLDLAEVAPVVVVAGNHDHPRRLEAVAPLLELGRVTVGSHLRPASDGGVTRITTEEGETARVALLPFLSQRHIVRADELMGQSRPDHAAAYADRMREIVRHLTGDLSTSDVNLVVGHVMVAGGLLGGGERKAHTVFDYVVPAQIFSGALTYVALGHLHRPQKVAAACPVWYSGSPLQLDFGEAGLAKAVLLVEAEPGLPPQVREVPLTSGVPLVRLSGTLAEVEEAAARIGEAYVRVELDEPARAGLADAVRELVPAAVDIVIARRTEDHAVSRPPRLGRPAHDLLSEYLAGLGVVDDRLVALFDELLESLDAT